MTLSLVKGAQTSHISRGRYQVIKRSLSVLELSRPVSMKAHIQPLCLGEEELAYVKNEFM